ncbi:hypothetical protein [Streptomyces sp. NPDC094468]|uniref:hypothetical protein n=1 Tax=Streptomyces sp. NPDC094468 TaxID=3366066 RepID=UPI0037F571FE
MPGGSANAYDYSNADPCNATDTDGMSPKCGQRRIKNGYGMRIVVQRRGGGVAKNGYRYMGYYINIQIVGFANRYLAFTNATYAETWGVPPVSAWPNDLAYRSANLVASWPTCTSNCP